MVMGLIFKDPRFLAQFCSRLNIHLTHELSNINFRLINLKSVYMFGSILYVIYIFILNLIVVKKAKI